MQWAYAAKQLRKLAAWNVLWLLPLQLLLNRVKAALHLPESLIEHAFTDFLLWTRDNITIETLLELASSSLDFRHTCRERCEIGDPSAHKNSHQQKCVSVRSQPFAK
jgi:hypothetical protein